MKRLALIWRVVVVVAVIAAAVVARAIEIDPIDGLDDLHRATCRVRATDANGRGAVGTGTCNYLNGGYYYVSTNWHVVDGATVFTLEFFPEGRPVSVPAEFVAAWHDDAPTDVAFLRAKESDFGRFKPAVVPLAGRGTKPTVGATVLSCGCSEGRAPLAFKGFIDSYFGETGLFYPAPKGGQSGSAILERIDGEWRQAGWCAYRVGDERTQNEEEMRGGLITIDNWYNAYDGRKTTGSERVTTPPDAVWCRLEVDATERKTDAKTDATSDDKKTCADIAVDAQKGGVCVENPGSERQIVENPTDFEIPVPSVWVAVEENSGPFFNYAIQTVEAAQNPAAQGVRLECVEFCRARGCPACDVAKPIVENLKKAGYVIHVCETENDRWANEAKSRGVVGVPTFIVYESLDNGKTWNEVDRYVGADRSLGDVLKRALTVGTRTSPQRKSTGPKRAADAKGVDAIVAEYGDGVALWNRKNRDDDNLPTDSQSSDSSGSSHSNSGLLGRLFGGSDDVSLRDFVAEEVREGVLEELETWRSPLFWRATLAVFLSGLLANAGVCGVVFLVRKARLEK